MKIPKIREKHGPEWHIQQSIITFLRDREWFVRSTHGCQYQSGFPDLFACKRRYGPRWIEVKYRDKYKFTPSQLETFPKFTAQGVPIWILTSTSEYELLFKGANWANFLPVNNPHSRSRSKQSKEQIEKPKPRGGPERDIQDSLTEALELDGWFVMETYGSLYQSGFPDLYVCKKGFGAKWIEVKNPVSYKFTPMQLDVFPRMDCEGVGIWIMTNNDLSVLENKPNWKEYLK